MEDDDERKGPDKGDPSITKVDRSSHTTAMSDHDTGSRRDEPSPATKVTPEHGTGSRKDEPDPGTIATPDNDTGSCRNELTPDTIATSERDTGSRRDEPGPDTIATFEPTPERKMSDAVAVLDCGEGAVERTHNEVIQVQSQSNIRITTKGEGPNLIGKNPTVVYNINEDGSEAAQAIGVAKQEIIEAVRHEGSELKQAIVGSSKKRQIKRVQKFRQKKKGLNRVNKSTYACDQGKKLDHEEMMKDLCGISTRQKEIMKQQEEMLMSSVKKNENADLTEQRNIIGQTENWIREERSSSQFVTTKAFAVAKEKIKEKRFVVIRGDSGAGKTRLAVELLGWLQLSTENHMFNGKKPLRLPNLQSWDKVISANSNLAILLDDVLGYSSDDTQNLAWWQQHAEMIKPIVHGKESVNYLVITVRNDIYQEYKSKFGCLSLFDEENVIDLSSPDYILKKERAALLGVYTSKINNFEQFTESEINQIIDVSPPIGFPECCRIFKITPELHSKRVTYFRRPLQILRMVIREKFNRAKQTALLYLLLSTEPVSTERLDFENECFDKEGIECVFRISAHVFTDSYNNTDSTITQLRCLQQGLDVLCGSFVHKSKGMFNFFHDSIRDTVAILYGEATPTGFLKNCPSSCLHYLATHQSRDTLCKVVIEESVYEVAYQRILRELESKQHSSYIAVASMSPWNDEEFLTRFFSWFKSNKYSPEDYFIRWETNVSLILTSDREVYFIPLGYISKDTPSSFLVYAAKMNSFSLLYKLLEKFKIEDISNHMKYAFDVALSEGSVECATQLLTLNIQPDFRSCCCAALGGEVKLMQMLAASIHALTDAKKWQILILTCLCDRYRICAYLLELFPFLLAHKAPLDKHLLHIIAESGSIECFKVVVNLVTRDCQSDEDKQLSLKSLIDGNGFTVLHSAFSLLNRNMIMYLLKEHPSLLTQKNKVGAHGLSLMSLCCKVGLLTEKDIESVIKRICHDDMNESLIYEDGNTILHWACRFVNEVLFVKLSSSCRSLLLLRNDRGEHCLHLISSTGNIECFKSVVALLLEENEREQYITSLVNKAGKTVLHLACHSGQLEMCLYLIREYPALMSKKDHHGNHCLHSIALSGNSESFKSIASLVLEGKSKPEKEHFMKNLQTEIGATVLHYACLDGKTDLCLYLNREYPQLLNQKDNFGYHCLHLIAQSGKVECFKAIAGLVLNGKSKTDMEEFMETLTAETEVKTLLHHAALTGKTEMCLYLIREYPKLFSQTNESGDHSLHYIAKSGNVECFKKIAPLGLDNMITTAFIENLLNESNKTVLHHACESGHKDMCLYLITEYPELFSQRDKYGNHCLHSTAQSGNVECFQAIFKLVLEHKTKPEREEFLENVLSEDEKTVLCHACSYGQTDMCLYLIREYPQLVNKKDKIAQHCLHVIADLGNVEWFKTIAGIVLKGKSKTDMERFMETRTVENKTVLDSAASTGKKEMCLYLIKEYPNLVDQKGRNEDHFLHLIAQSGNVDCFKSVAAFILNGKAKTEREQFLEKLINDEEETVLHHACVRGQTDMCLYLYREYPKLFSQTNKTGDHSLHYIAESGNVECFKTIASIVLEDKTKTECELFMEKLANTDKETILHHACTEGQTEMCLYLIREYPELVHKRDRYGCHCFHWIARSGNIECFKSITDFVLKDIAKPKVERFVENLIDENSSTVLHEACSNGQTQMCSYLIGTYPKLLSQTNHAGFHCLHFIAQSGNVECFQSISSIVLKDETILERERSMATLLDRNGSTVLHHAAEYDKTEMCSYLIKEYPKLVDQKGRDEQHFLHLIAQTGNVECFQSISTLVMKDQTKLERERFMGTLLDLDGFTVLHYAAVYDKTEMCTYLIKEYPKLVDQKGRDEQHFLHLIAQTGNVECFQSISTLVMKDQTKLERERFMETLLDLNGSTVLRYADFFRKTEMCAYLIKQYPKLMSQTDRFGHHCLHLTAQLGNVKERVMIEGEKIMDTLTHNDDKTSLHHMCVTGNTGMCLYLIKEYPSTLHQKGPLGSQCLHLIAASGNVNCFKSVIPLVHSGKTKYEAEQFIKTLTDDYGQTCLHHACVKGHTEMCLYLADEYWSLLEKKNRYGSHCLHLVAKSGRVEFFKKVIILILGDKPKLLLETFTNRNGKTVLHKAGVKGKTEMCQYLVSEFPSLLSQRSVGGNHCLHYIAQSGQIECFKSVASLTLKGKNAKEREQFMLDLKNNRGKTVLEKARENRQTEMYSYLERQFNFLSEKKLHSD